MFSGLTVAAPFAGYDGYQPVGGPVVDAAGDVFGVTAAGGGGRTDQPLRSEPDYAGQGGVVFEIPADTKALTVLARFSTAAGGLTPTTGPTLDAAGNLYGTTASNGNGGRGTIRELPAGATATVPLASLAVFPSPAYDPGHTLPVPLAVDAAGDLFGTLSAGGTDPGLICELPAGSSTVLSRHAVTDADGADPTGPLTPGPGGTYYGTTAAGGVYGAGTVYRFDPATGAVTTLYSFAGPADGSGPGTGVVVTAAGHLAGTTAAGGPNGTGTIFDLDPAIAALAHVVPLAAPTAGGLAAGPGGTLVAAVPLGGTGHAGAFLWVDPLTFAVTAEDAPAIPTADPGFTAVGSPLVGTTGRAVDAAGDVFGNVSQHPGYTDEFEPAAVPDGDYLDVIQTPTFAASGQPVDGVVKVAVRSGPHQIDRSATGTVRLTCPEVGDALSGTLTVPVIDGIATLAGLTVTDTGGADLYSGRPADGSSYELAATDGVHAPADPTSEPCGAASGGGGPFNGLTSLNDDMIRPTVIASTLPATLPAGRSLGHRTAVTVSLDDQAGWPAGTPVAVTVFASPDGTTVAAVPLATVAHALGSRDDAHVRVPIAVYPSALTAGTYELFARVTDLEGAEVVSAPGPLLAEDGGAIIGRYQVPRTITVVPGVVKLVAFFNTDVNEFSPGDPPASITTRLENEGSATDRGRFTIDLSVEPAGTVAPVLRLVHRLSARLAIKAGGVAQLRVPVGPVAGVNYPFAIVAMITDPAGNAITLNTFNG